MIHFYPHTIYFIDCHPISKTHPMLTQPSMLHIYIFKRSAQEPSKHVCIHLDGNTHAITAATYEIIINNLSTFSELIYTVTIVERLH